MSPEQDRSGASSERPRPTRAQRITAAGFLGAFGLTIVTVLLTGLCGSLAAFGRGCSAARARHRARRGHLADFGTARCNGRARPPCKSEATEAADEPADEPRAEGRQRRRRARAGRRALIPRGEAGYRWPASSSGRARRGCDPADRRSTAGPRQRAPTAARPRGTPHRFPRTRSTSTASSAPASRRSRRCT